MNLMGRRVSNQALIAVAGGQVINKWVYEKRGGIVDRFCTKSEFGIPVIAQYTGVILHDYYESCDDHLGFAADIVANAIEDVLGMRCERFVGDEGNLRYLDYAYENDSKVLGLHFDIMRTFGHVYTIEVLAVNKYENEAQQLAGLAMKALDKTVKELVIKPTY